MNYGFYNSNEVTDINVKNPVQAMLKTSLKKRVIKKKAKGNGDTSKVYIDWLSFLKKKTLFDEFMLYSSVIESKAIEFDSYEAISKFCKELGYFRLVLKKDTLYVNWGQVFNEFIIENDKSLKGRLRALGLWCMANKEKIMLMAMLLAIFIDFIFFWFFLGRN